MARLYRLLARLLFPLARLYLLWRARRQPDYLRHWDERFARVFPEPGPAPRFWIHAVSVGEVNAAAPLLGELLRRWPGQRALLTCMTPTGRDAARRLADRWPGRIDISYLPYDVPSWAARFLTAVRPTLAIFMETEVWPNLLAEARARAVPLVLANARLSEKSLRQTRRVGAVTGPAYAAFDLVLAQSEADADRLRQAGCRQVRVAGSLKFDLPPDPAARAAARAFRARLGRPVLLLASTREGEEALFAPLLPELAGSCLILLVPRHPQRFDEVAALLRRQGLSVVRRSGFATLGEIEVGPSAALLGDSMGEMAFYCACADVCLMGGSFVPTGCQNLIEPAAAGVPTILGPSRYNFARAAADALAMGAALSAADPAEGLALARELLTDGERRRRVGQAARAFAARYIGATEVMVEAITGLYEERHEPTPDP